MHYSQSLGSSTSGRDRQQPPIKVKKRTSRQYKAIKNKIFKMNGLILGDHLNIAEKKQEPLIKVNKHN